MKKAVALSIAALALMTLPSYAVSLYDVSKALKGFHLETFSDGNAIWDKKQNGVAHHPGSPAAGSVSHVKWDDGCPPFHYMTAGGCVMQGADVDGGGTPATPDTPVCNVTTATVSHDRGANLFTGYNITTSASSTGSACPSRRW